MKSERFEGVYVSIDEKSPFVYTSVLGLTKPYVGLQTAESSFKILF